MKWFKNGQELNPDVDKRIKLKDLGNGKYGLEIDNASQDDIGDYTVEASNEAGSAKSEAPVDVEKGNFSKPLRRKQQKQADT